MALGDNPAFDTGEERIEDPSFVMFPKGSKEYRRELKSRGGGPQSGNKKHRPLINTTVRDILTPGTFTDDQVRALIHRNPGAAIEYQSAFQRRQQTQEILGGAITRPETQLQTGTPLGGGTTIPEQLAGQVSQAPESFQEVRPDEVLRREGKFSREAAISQAERVGRFDIADRLRKGRLKKGKAREPKFVVKKVVGADGVERFVKLSEGDLARGVKTFKRISNKDSADIDSSLAVAKNIAIPLFNALNPKISAKKRAELEAQGITADPDAVGAKGALFDFILNRVDPKGTSVRQLATNLSSAILKQRSGAQVSDKEYARLQPFLLTGKETSAEALKKSRLLVREYLAILRERNKTFSTKNGFVPHSGLKRFFSKDQSVKAIQSRAEGKGSPRQRTSSGGLTPAQQKRLDALRRKQR